MLRIGAPSEVTRIQADGNCLFRAIAMVMTDDEENHFKIREQLVEHMRTISAIIEAYLPTRYSRVDEYIRRTRMTESGRWGSVVEIYTAVHLFRTDIYVYSKPGNDFEWARHQPDEVGVEKNIQCKSIYLRLFDNHFDVVQGKEDKHDLAVNKNGQDIDFEKYSFGEILGSGGCSDVYKCAEDDALVIKAVKVGPNPTRDIRSNMRILQNEIKIFKLLYHKRIIHYFGSYTTNTHLCLVVEKMSRGSLWNQLDQNGAFGENLARKYTSQTLDGLEYLHECGIIHRDLKGANILLDESGDAKICDFGLAKLVEATTKVVSLDAKSKVGTPHWTAPEVVKGTGHGRSCDIWSLGCTLVEMMTTNPPWHELDNWAAIVRIATGERPVYKLPSTASKTLRDFLELCFTVNPAARLTATDLKRHAFIREDQAIGLEHQPTSDDQYPVNNLSSVIYQRQEGLPVSKIRANTMAGTPIARPAQRLISCSNLHSDDGSLKVYQLPLQQNPLKSLNARECIVKTDNQVDAPYIKEKTILLVGQSGSGKSTMIDAMMNYIVGVRREDPFRFKLIDMTEEENGNSKDKVKSQTNAISCYTIPRMHGTEIPYTVKLVDTPGTLSTQGTKSLQQHRDNIKHFFTKNAISFLDAVCFIVKASDARLNATQTAIFDDMQIFGKDVQQYILIVTFCDNNKPAAMKTIEAARLHFKHHYRVNNAGLYDPDACGDDPDQMCKLLWEMTESSMNKLFQRDLQNMSSCSITVSRKDCIRKYELEDRLDKITQELDDKIRHNERRLAFKYTLDNHNNETDEWEVPGSANVTVPMRERWAMNCKTCRKTCHDGCLVFTDKTIRCCSKFDGVSDLCKKCRHSAAEHESCNYRIVPPTLANWKQHYGVEGKGTADLINAVEMENSKLELEQESLIRNITSTIEELNTIAPKQVQSKTLEYVQSAIMTENEEHKEGWEDRVRGLERLKERYTSQSEGGNNAASSPTATHSGAESSN